MKDRILKHLVKIHPQVVTAVELGVEMGAGSEKEAYGMVLAPLDELYRERLIGFEVDKERRSVIYSAVL